MIGVCINWVATPQSPHRLRTKTATVIKREASNAEGVQLQCALAAYQEALLSNDVLSVCEAARRFNVPKTTLQERFNGQSVLLSSILRSPGLVMLRAR